MPSKFNPKKFFKGTNVYGYGDSKYSYAVSDSGYVAVRMLRNSKIRDVIAKDITFADFSDKRPKEQIKEAMDKVFNSGRKMIECQRLRLALQARLDMVYLYAPVDGRQMLRGVQSHWVEALGDVTDWRVFIYGEDRYDPMLFLGDGAEIIIQPIKFEADSSVLELGLIEDEARRVREML